MGRALVQRIQGGPHDAITHACKPAGISFALLVHVQPQDFNEQHLGQLGQYTGATRSRRACLLQRIAD